MSDSDHNAGRAADRSVGEDDMNQPTTLRPGDAVKRAMSASGWTAVHVRDSRNGDDR